MASISRAGLASVVAAWVLAACGGGGSTPETPVTQSPTPTPTPTPSPTPTPTPTPTLKATISTKVIDGPIKGAIVCLDKNSNGLCDAGEPQATTDAQGSVSFQVDAADVGKYPLVAYVGTDAVDTDHGPVTVPFLMSTTADATSLITPFTTIIQQTVSATGATTEQAVQSVKEVTGIAANLFADPVALGEKAQTLARLIVLTSQALTTELQKAVGEIALDKTTITKESVYQAANAQTLLFLPQIVTAATSGQTDTQLRQSATTVVADGGITKDSSKLLVAAINSASIPPPPENGIPFNVTRSLQYRDRTNYLVRFFTGTAQQATIGTDGFASITDRKVQSSNGNISRWSGTNITSPSRSNDFYFNGTAWTQCAIDRSFRATPLSDIGTSNYNFCDNFEIGRTDRTSIDVSGQSMLSVYYSIRSAGIKDTYIESPEITLEQTTFPSGSKLRFNTSSTQSRALYFRNNPSNRIFEPTNPSCTGAYTSRASTSLESMVSKITGLLCNYNNSDSFSYQGTTYNEPIVTNYIRVLAVATIGNLPTGTGVAPGFYSGNIKIMAAFDVNGTNAVSYYRCKEKFLDGNSRACEKIQDGTYVIETLGDARILKFVNLPEEVKQAGYYLVPIERGGFLYYGVQPYSVTFAWANFNSTATDALMSKLGIPLEDPASPLALTAGSYQGTYRLFNLSGKYIKVVFNADGTASCSNAPTSTGTLVASTSCSFTITDPAFGSPTTGKFTLVNTATSVAVTTMGTIDFMSGLISSTSSTDSSSWSGYRE